jgi:hypothetical protein
MLEELEHLHHVMPQGATHVEDVLISPTYVDTLHRRAVDAGV